MTDKLNLTALLSRKRTESSPSLGQVLLEAKVITEEQLDAALQMQREGDSRRLGDILIDKGWLDPSNLAMALSVHLNLPYIDLKRHTVSTESLALVPEEIAREENLIPLDSVDGSLVVVMEDPTDVEVIEEITAISGMNVSPTVSSKPDIRTAIDLHYKALSDIEREIASFAPLMEAGEALETAEFELAVEDDPVVRAVNLILGQAVRDRASDIHIVPGHRNVRIRFRVDGVLQDTLTLATASLSPLLSRIKVMAGMDIAERRRPQDGQFSSRIGEEEIFFRVATSDTTWGEMVTLRVLGRSESILDIKGLGLQESTLSLFQRILHSPYGMVLVSGPTGSGKTTTLYAALNQLDRVSKNIMTIEDPVEYNFNGINQIRVNRNADITFASGLRGIMRLDPDVIMVGEVRDEETSEAAIQAALTGHLVFSSVHANDAPGTLYRLTYLGVEPYMVVSAIVGAVSQRLVRKICPYCKVEVEPKGWEMEAYQREMSEPLSSHFSGEGCSFCAGTGYLGRTGVFEVMIMSDEIRRLFMEGESVVEIRTQSLKEGMTTMRRDGMMKVKQGITTPSEVMRNVSTLT